MELDFTGLSAGQVYSTMIQTLVPRPIAWVLSENENTSFNLAPFSYFNAVSSDPPILMFSVGKHPDGTHKDTRINIEARPHFVVHIPSADQIDAVNDSSATLPNESSEVEQLQLTTTEFSGFSLPRIDGSPVAYACELYEIKEIGNTPMSMILGKINAAYIDDEIVETTPTGSLRYDAQRINPLGRLGGPNYVTLGEKLSRKRPD